MRFNLKKTLAGAAAVAIVATVAPFIGSSVASAATSNGAVTLNPLNGDSGTNFSFTYPSTPACAGDNLTGYNWSTFLVPSAVDVNTQLTFDGLGPILPAAFAGQYRGSLVDNLGTTLVAQGPNLGSFLISPFTFNYSLFFPGEVPAGTYKIGVACTTAGGATLDTYWERLVTVTADAAGGPAQFTLAQGAQAVAPTLNSVVPGNGQLTVNFTGGGSDPADTSYIVIADSVDPLVPDGIDIVTASPATLTGLVNGEQYSVTVIAENGVPTPGVGSVPSNAILATPNLPGAPPVTLSAVSATGEVTFNWTYTPPAGTTLSGYEVAIAGGATTTVGVGVNTFTQAGPAGVPITATVTPLFSAPAGQLGDPASATGTPLAAQVLNQVITATRPNGNLVLTQVCGAYGPLDAEGAQLGFPTGLPAETAVNTGFNPSTDGGLAPYLTQGDVPFSAVGTTAGPGDAPVAAGAQDPVFAGYPYPDNPVTGEATPTYPTWCGIELGAARFVRTGAPIYGQGQYYAADGRLNQVTVVDTRDGDGGWNIAASVTDFTAAGGKSFSANQLGWTPRVARDTGAFTDSLGNTYDQTTAAGPGVAQNTFLTGNGLGNPPANTLISALGRSAGTPVTGDPNQVTSFTGGLGIAVADARIKLAIPVTALSGNYTAVMTISAL